MDSNKRYVEGICKSKIFLAVVGLIVVLCSGHAFQSVYNWVNYFVLLPTAVFVFIIISEIGALRLRTVDYAWLALMMMCLVSLLVNAGEALTVYIQLISYITVGYFIATHFSFDGFVKWYLRIMTVVTVASLIGYLLLNNTELLDWLPKVSNIKDFEYGVGVIFNYITVVPDRNCGMFWEPGLFASTLIIALVFELVFKKDKVSWVRVILFGATIFTVNSSAGFVLLFFTVMLLFARNLKIKNIYAWWVPIAVVGLAASVVLLLNIETIISTTSLAENEYFEKLLSENVLESSRTEAVKHNLEVFSSDPIFGVGYIEAAERMEHVADTSTSTYLLSVYGIPGALYTIFWIVGIFKQRKNVFVKIILLAIFLLIINKEPHQNLAYSWIILFFLLKDTESADSCVADGGEND